MNRIPIALRFCIPCIYERSVSRRIIATPGAVTAHHAASQTDESNADIANPMSDREAELRLARNRTGAPDRSFDDQRTFRPRTRVAVAGLFLSSRQVG